MKVKFKLNGHAHQGKVVATIVEEVDVSPRTTTQVIRFVVLLPNGTFISVPIKDCQIVRSWWNIFFKQ